MYTIHASYSIFIAVIYKDLTNQWSAPACNHKSHPTAIYTVTCHDGWSFTSIKSKIILFKYMYIILFDKISNYHFWKIKSMNDE